MGGRGKSSGAAKRPMPTGAPKNFADPGAIPLERLESANACGNTKDVAMGVEQVIEQMLSASPELYAQHEATLERVLAETARMLKTCPAEEREAFASTLAPLLGRLREQAEGRLS